MKFDSAPAFFSKWSSQAQCAISLVFRPPPLLYDSKRWHCQLPACRAPSGRQQTIEVLSGLAVAWKESRAWFLPLPPRRPPIASFSAQAEADSAVALQSNAGSSSSIKRPRQDIGLLAVRLPARSVATIVSFVGVRCLKRTKGDSLVCSAAPWISRTWACFCIEEYNRDWDELVAPRWLAIQAALSFPMQLAAFDVSKALRALSRFGVSPSAALVDTRIANWLLGGSVNSGRSLNALHENCFPNKSNLYVVSASSAVEVSCHEAVTVRKVAAHLLDRLSDEALDEPFHDVEMPLVASIVEMETWGIGVQSSYLSTLSDLVREQVGAMETEAAGFDCELKAGNQNDALEDAIYTNLKLKAPNGFWKDSKGKTNKRPVKSDALLLMADQHPLPGIIVRWRSFMSILHNSLSPGKFSKSSISMPVFNMRRCIPCVDQMTATGRMYFTNPNVQNVPKEVTCAAAARDSLQVELDSDPHWQIDLTDSSSTAVWLMSSYCIDGKGRFRPLFGYIVEVSNNVMSDPLPPSELDRQTLMTYWREKGVVYSEEDASRVRVVKVCTGYAPPKEQGSSANILLYPADRVFRRILPAGGAAAARSADSRWPTSFPVNVRDAFVACMGCTLITADYSQVEIRVMAHFSKEPTMLRILNEGGDVFRGIAATWLKCAPEEVQAEQRNNAKQVVYSILYGQGVKGLANQLEGTSTERASSMVHSFFKTFPELQKFTKSVVSQCHKLGYVETICGRRRLLPDIHSSEPQKRAAAERQAVNTLCQGSAADLMKCAMISIRERLLCDFPPASINRAGVGQVDLTPIPPIRLVLQIHDELMFEVPDQDPVALQAAIATIRTELEAAFLLAVPLKVVIKQGRRWGSMETV